MSHNSIVLNVLMENFYNHVLITTCPILRGKDFKDNDWEPPRVLVHRTHLVFDAVLLFKTLC